MSHKADGEKVENRPKCDWPVTTADGGKTETNPCGSEERIYQVSTPDVDYWGHKSTSERNVCQRCVRLRPVAQRGRERHKPVGQQQQQRMRQQERAGSGDESDTGD